MAHCEECMFYIYDEQAEEYVCDVNVDEDEYARLQNKGNKECPYYRNYDEYKVVKHQI